MSAGARPDSITEECWGGEHQSCTGYTEPSWDPDLCDCQCHEDVAAEMVRERDQ